MVKKLRVILDGPRGGAENMAIDEALLRSGNGEPTLRLYRWDEPTLSLGYFQSTTEIARAGPQAASLPLIRRPTGGGAIVHADELTYCLIVPTPEHTDAGQLYAWMHGVIAGAASSLDGPSERASLTMRDGGEPETNGEFFCFRRRGRYDLLVASTTAEPLVASTSAEPMAGEAKVAGSAQRRTRAAILQHGSVILQCWPAQGGASLSDVLGRRVGFDELAAAVVEAIRGRNIRAESGALTAAERRLAGELRNKHESPQWLRRR